MSMADRGGFIWYDGQLVPWRNANTHILTHSLHYGLAVFEGMRAALLEERIAWAHLAAAFALNAVWLAGMGWLFLRQFQSARVRGALLNIGE